MRTLVASLLLPLLVLSACEGGVVCPEGTLEDEDGNCFTPEDTDTGETDTGEDTDVPDEDPGLDDIIVESQPCTPLAAGDRLQPEIGCADGVCARATLRDAVQAVGRPPECAPGPTGYNTCAWPSGVSAYVYDGNESGTADPFETIIIVEVSAPFGGASPDGLGLGISPGCYAQVYGKPTSVMFYEDDKGTPLVSYAYWRDAGVVMRDNEGGPQPFYPDGRVDSMSLYGPAQGG